MRTAVLLTALIAVATACAIDRRSDDFACSSSRDCNSGRSCIDNVCVLGVVDAAPCPSNCSSCDVSARTCTIDCATANCAARVVCPAGWACNVKCNAENSCRNGVSCANTTSCSVECLGKSSCQDVVCGAGKCTVDCSGEQSCRNVACGSSCACDVTCGGSSSCRGQLLCTQPTCGTLNPRGCSSVSLLCHTC